jgi:hypothetical protein
MNTTKFMHLFDLPEVELVHLYQRYNISTDEYVDMCVNMNMFNKLNIPYVKLSNGKRNGSYFSLESEEVEIPLYGYGFNNCLWASLKPQHLVNYNLDNLSKRIQTKYYFSWDDYKNKKGIIDDIGKLKFLNDILKQKTKNNATSKR